MKHRIFVSTLLLITVLPSYSDTLVQTFSGSGASNTRPFRVTNGWEIQWEAEGDIFQLFLYTENGELVGVPANQQGSGKGSSYQPNSGTYYLQVNAIGSWTLRVVQVASSTRSGNTQSHNAVSSNESYMSGYNQGNIIGALLLWIAVSVGIGALARKWNRSFRSYTFLSILTSPVIGFIVLMIAGKKSATHVVASAQTSTGMTKACPNCGNRIPKDRWICDKCGATVPD